MDAAVTAGIIGLAGAMTGSAATFIGVVYQQRHTARTSAEAHRQGAIRSATQILLHELLDIQAVLRRSTTGLTGEEIRTRSLRLHEHLSVVLVNLQWLPDGALRQRVRENAAFVNMSPPGDERTATQKRADAMWLCADSITCLGAYLREEPVPDRYPDVENIITRWPDLRGGTSWFMES